MAPPAALKDLERYKLISDNLKKEKESWESKGKMSKVCLT